MPQKGEKYRHYKGNVYEVMCVATTEADGETKLVIYQDTTDSSLIWARPLAMFIEEVEVDGMSQPRFERLL